MNERLRECVARGLASLGAKDVPFSIEWPADPAHGDFATNAAMTASKALGKPPLEIAEALISALKESLGDAAADVRAAGPGFINVTLSRSAITEALEGAADEAWGRNASQAGKRVMVEYGNPNPFKEMHIGHLVGTIIGESFSRLIEYSGATVLRDTFGGDVGPQVAKALWVFLKDGVTDIASAQEIGKAYAQGATAYEESETAKAEIDALNTRLYDVVAKLEEPAALNEEDRALLALWQKGREVSMEEFGQLFALLGTKHDYTFFDSDTTRPGMDAVRDAVKKGVLEESDGAVIYRGESKGLHTLVFITSRGTPTYETKDVGLAILKELRAPTDEVIILTGSEQAGHFKVVLAALEEIVPHIAAKMRHVTNGLLQLATGKMSSRKGNVITARELIKDLIMAAAERNPDPVIAEQVAVGALKYMVLRSAPGANIIFDPAKSLSLDGDSGPYLQYAYVRAQAIIAKAEDATMNGPAPAEPYLIERLLMRFPDVVGRAQAELAPQHLAQYLTQLAGEWNSFYAKERILGDKFEAHKLGTARAFARTMAAGLWLLGIPVPERM